LLAPGLRKYIADPPFSFSAAELAANTGIPMDAHVELQHWQRRVNIEFRELTLRTLLADLQTSMRTGS
jgi:hypothetical protein